jgi:transcriptional regulator with XRE-family HTH domain
MSVTPNIRRRLVGNVLRDYRQDMGFSLTTAASIIGCHISKLSRIETGERGIRAAELRDLLTEYHVAEPEFTLVTNLANSHRDNGWRRDFPGLMTEAQREYLIMEAAATIISTYHAQQIPGLLQTEDYARAIAAADPAIPTERTDYAIATLKRRQKTIVDDPEHEVAVVLSEAALKQNIGGTKVMRDQLAHLAELAEHHPGVTLQILPFSSGAQPAFATGGMTILSCGTTTGIGVVRLPAIGGGAWLEDRDDVTRHLAAFTQLRHHALTPDDSQQMIWKMAR